MMKKHILVVMFLAFFNAFNSLELYAQNRSWVEDSFEDFADGKCSASGIDLYVTKDGMIKTINRYDLNNDGFLDLVFNTGHELRDGVAPTLYSWPSDQEEGIIRQLPVDGTKEISISDLNNDGYDDAVFLPNENGVSPRRYLSILWGDRTGWSNQRKSQLVTISARKMEISDMNGDSWSELLVLNGSRWSPLDGPEQVLRWYWGSKYGFQQNEYKDILLENAVDFVVRDLNNNGLSDLIVLLTNPGRICIYLNPGIDPGTLLPEPQKINLGSASVGKLVLSDFSGNGRMDMLVTGGERELIGKDPTTGEEQYRYSGIILVESIGDQPLEWSSPEVIKAPPTSDIQVSDLDKDGRADIVLADLSARNNSVHILWGNSKRDRTYPDRTSLPVAYASAIDIADLDGDSHPDLAIAVYRSEKTYDSESVVFLGEGNREFNRFRHLISSAGAGDIVVVASEREEPPKIVIANARSGRYFEDTPSKVYWGSNNGFDPEMVSRFDIRSGYTSAAADLNNDGFTDLVLLSIVHAIKEPHPGIGFNILWGGPDGLQNNRRTVLNEYGLYDVSIADIDKDGFLDLLGSVGYGSPDGESPGVVVWFGSKQGFFKDKRIRIKTEARPTQHALADFNKDGFLDVALLIGNKHKISILWGGESGFSQQKVTSWPFLRGGDMNTADLNGDGWLDLVVSSLLIPNSLFYDFGTYIFWGGVKGFDPTRVQKLIGHGTVGITIADWDQDGFLDVFLPSYKYTETREAVAAHLYWGQRNGFSDTLRTDFLQNSGHGGMAGDFNSDGKLDLVISNHRSDGDHSTNSRVYYAKEPRFKNAQVQFLPTVGSEFIYSDDLGAQYNRSFEKEYLSSVFEWEEPLQKGSIDVKAKTEGSTRLQVSVRTAGSAESLEAKSWKSLDSNLKTSFEVSPQDRYMQYRLIFISDNGDRYPEVDRVKLSLSVN